jgi:hypothetical protein
MERSDDAQALYRRPNVGLPRAVFALFVLGMTVAVGPEAESGVSAIETNCACSDPQVPTLILTVEFPRDAAVIEHALRTDVCQHTDEPMPVTPVLFIRRVKTTPTSAEPYGYIWAIRLGERKMAYWFFWKDAHETMLKRMPSI